MSCSGGLVPGSGLTPDTACALVSGICQTLRAEGATDQQMIDVATGCIADTELLNELIQNYQPPVNVTSTLSDTLLGGLGSVADAISDPVGGDGIVQQFERGLGNIGTWFSSNYILIIGIGIAALLLIVWAYGGFKLGFIQG